MPNPSSLVGNIYRGTDAGAPVRPFVVVEDRGDVVVVDSVEPPHRQRSLRRRRLDSYHYAFVGRQDLPNGEVREFTPLPTFDGLRFAAWLRGWMRAEKMQVPELARAAGLSESSVHQLRRGEVTKTMRDRGQTGWQPALNVLAAVAHALDLEFSYVAAKAGLSDEGDRWRNFTTSERALLAELLDADDLDAALREMTTNTKEPA